MAEPAAAGTDGSGMIGSWPLIISVAVAAGGLVVVAILVGLPEATANYFSSMTLVIFPAIALVAMVASWWLVRKQQFFKAFLCSSAMIALLLFSGAISLYPNLLVSTLDAAYNLTIFNGAAAPNSLLTMLIIALIGMPFVLAYTAGVYYIFRGKVKLSPESY